MNVLEIVNTKIIEKLKSGVNPWIKPWNNAIGGFCKNLKTNKFYNGINQFILEKSTFYATFKQISEIGGKIKKGAKSEMVVFSKTIERDPLILVNAETGEQEAIDNDYFCLKYFNVFKAEDIENLEEISGKIKDKEKLNQSLKNQELIKLSQNDNRFIEQAEKIIKKYCSKYGVKINNDEVSNRAYYKQSDDSITIPVSSQFENITEYYSTIFHELGHSTGYLTRLDRLSKIKTKGGNKYSKEELIAEITAVLCLNYLGIDSSQTNSNSAAYLKNWADHLDEKKNTWFILNATNEAEKAFKMICGLDEATEEQEVA